MNRLSFAVTLPLVLMIYLFHSTAFTQDKAEASGTPAPPVQNPGISVSEITRPVALPADKSDTLTPEIQAIRDAIQVNWFQPQGFPDREKKLVRVALVGQSKQGTRIYLKSNEIKELKTPTNIVTKKLTKDDVKFLPGLADQRGIFAFEVNLPPGNYQISVAVVDPEAQTMSAAKIYVLFLNVSYKGVEFGFIEEGQDKPFVPQSDYYSFGMGFNYAVFNKEVPAVPSEIRFSSFKFPSLRLGYAKTWNPEWRIHAYLLAAPGETKTGTRIPVDGGSYLWTILSADGIYSRDPWKLEWGSYKVRYAVRGGLQVHSVPFIQSVSSLDNTQGISNISYTTPVVGGHVDLMTDGPISYEGYMRLGIPFIAQAGLKLSDSFLFDGSIGGRYRAKKSAWSYGVFWSGQWLKFKFNEDDKFVSSNVDGSFDILNSNLEFRIHYHY